MIRIALLIGLAYGTGPQLQKAAAVVELDPTEPRSPLFLPMSHTSPLSDTDRHLSEIAAFAESWEGSARILRRGGAFKIAFRALIEIYIPDGIGTIFTKFRTYWSLRVASIDTMLGPLSESRPISISSPGFPICISPRSS